MRIAKVVGKITLSSCHETFVGATLRLVAPCSLAEVSSKEPPKAEELVVWDELGAADGAFIAYSDGGEAAQPFRPNEKPVDAYLAAILDDVQLD